MALSDIGQYRNSVPKAQFIPRGNGEDRLHNSEWPSAVLHKVTRQMKSGLAVKRVEALANFIKQLPMHRDKEAKEAGSVMGGPLTAIYGNVEVSSYRLLDLSEKGFGRWYICRYEGEAKRYFTLTGYGIICWASVSYTHLTLPTTPYV